MAAVMQLVRSAPVEAATRAAYVPGFNSLSALSINAASNDSASSGGGSLPSFSRAAASLAASGTGWAASRIAILSVAIP